MTRPVGVGDWVRYRGEDGSDQLAIVTDIWPDDTCVMTNRGALYRNFILESRPKEAP